MLRPTIRSRALLSVVVACLLTTITVGFTGSARADEPAARKYPYRIATTVAMVADIVREVAGDRAEVIGIIGEGVDPHLYKPSRNDVAELLKADMVFYSGLMLEGKMSDTLIRVASRKPVKAVTQLIGEKLLLEPEEMEGHFDPHVWMDASLWAKAVEAVAVALGEFDPANASAYTERGKAYAAKCMELHEYGKRCMATIPEQSRVLVTSHDAFNYFGRAYGLTVRGVQGISTESEAGLRDINELIDFIVERKVKAVFVETSVPQKNIRALIDGAKAKGIEVKVGGELFSDAMGTAGTYEGTYLGMLDHNITTVTRALGGQAPEGGMSDKLKKHHE